MFKKSISVFLLFILAITGELKSHEIGQSLVFLNIYENQLTGHLEVIVDDVNRALGISLPTDGSATTEMLEPYRQQIIDYLRSKLRLGPASSPYTLTFGTPEIYHIEIADYVTLKFESERLENIPEQIGIEFTPLFEIDKDHVGVLIEKHNWKNGIFDNQEIPTLFFSPGKSDLELDISKSSKMRGFVAVVKEGIRHIWIGIDHILFLLALLLPSVYRLVNSRREPVEKFKSALWYTVKVITFFTIAHTVTLSLASLNIISLNARFVESIIAFSIALAALHNLVPLWKGKDWIIAFAFGLFHGFGFANVLEPLGLGTEHTFLSLFGFNLGVEIGQVVIIILIFPILFLLRKTKVYPWIYKWASILLIAIAMFWFFERALDIPLTDMLKDIIKPLIGRG